MDVVLNALGVKEYASEFNKAFIVKEGHNFSQDELKEIDRCMGDNCISCNKVLFNGKIKFLYITEKYRTLISVLDRMNKKSFMKCLLQIIQCEYKVKTSEKLDERKLLIDKRYIFWDMEAEQVKMVYLPVVDVDISEENILCNLKVFLKWLIESVTILDSRTEGDLLLAITDMSVTLEEMYDNLSSMLDKPAEVVKKKQEVKTLHQPKQQSKQCVCSELVLEMKDSKQQVIFRIKERDFVIGRSVKFADGVVPENIMIGRKHCRIKFLQNKYFLEDLDSRNGTYINGKRVIGSASKEIAPNDVIRLANVEFVAKFVG